MTGSENGRGPTSSLISRATREPRTRSAVTWSEFLPRYLLIEEALKKRTVLEVGTLDLRSLLKLHDAGSARVLGTAPDLSRLDRALLRGRPIDLLRMEPGRLDFGDAAFDAILVVDLAKELAHNSSFLSDLRRILRPDGFALLGYAAGGRSLVELVDEDPKILAIAPSEMEASVRAVFPDTHFYFQSPFVGVAIHPQGLDPTRADVSLDPSLAGASRPSHVIALCGRAPEAVCRTLVELPFVAFEAMTDAAQERSQSDLSRLLDALRSAREQIALRDRSLEAIKKRLPRIRDALLARTTIPSAAPSEAVPSPTVIDRPTDEGHRFAELESRIDTLDVALDEERRRRLSAEAKLRALEDESDEREDDTFVQPAELAVLERELMDREQEKHRLESEIMALRKRDLERATEVALLENRSRDLAADLADAIARTRQTQTEQSELTEARRRITQLERTASAQEQELDELRGELESQFVVRHSLGDEYRDAETRVAYLNARLEDLALGHSQEQRRAEERIKFLAGALNAADQERETLRARLAEIEDGTQEMIERSEQFERGHRYASQELEVERSEHYQIRGHFDDVRMELFEKASTVEKLERALADRDAQIMFLKKEHSSTGADRKAVELAAGHLAKEVEQLRKRVQSLRNERDTLAATSRLLLEERDTAAVLGRHAVEAEQRAQQLQLSLEGGQAAIERLERELDDVTLARDAMEQRFLDAQERLRMLEKDLERRTLSIEQASGRFGEQQNRQRELDKKLAEQADRVNTAERGRDAAVRDRVRLEELLREAHQENSGSSREVRRLEERIAQLTASQKSAEQELGKALAARASAEAEVVRVHATADDFRGKNALLVAELAELAQRDRGVRAQMTRLARELEQKELALSKTLSQAAESVASGERERMQIEHQRQAAEVSRRSAEAGRAHAVAEVRALTAERAQVIGKFEAELHQARERIREIENDKTLETELANLEGERLALMVWAEELDISRRLAEANAERLRTDSARHQVASEEAEDEARGLDVRLANLQRTLALDTSAAGAAEEREQLEARVAILAAESARRQQELVIVKGSLVEQLDTIGLLEMRNAELEDRLKRTRSDRSRLTEETDQRVEQLGAALEEARQQRASAESRAREADEQLTEAVTWLEATEQRAAEVDAKLSQAARELLDVDEKFLDACAELEKARAERSQLEAQLAERSEALQVEVRRARELEQRRALIEERNGAFQSDLRGQLSEKSETLAAELRRSHEVASALERARAELTSVRASLEETSESLVRANAEVRASQSARVDAQLAAERAEKHAAELEQTAKDIDQLRGRLSEATHRIAELEASEREVVELRGELAGTQAEVGDLRAKLQSSVAELGWANSEVAAQRAKLDAGGARAEELEAELSQARQRIGLLEGHTREASDLAARLKQVERRASELQAALANAELKVAGVEAAARESVELRSKVQEAQRRTVELETKVKELESRPTVSSLDERAVRAEATAARAESQLAKESSSAREAETRARNAEILARNAEERASQAENRRRSAEVRALDAEAKAKHAERKLLEAEQQLKQYEPGPPKTGDLPVVDRAELEQMLDEARAELGRKMSDLRTAREDKARIERELADQKHGRAALETKLVQHGDADRLKEEVDRRDQQIARFRAEASSVVAEKNRLRALIQSSEQNQVQLERRIAELETALAESNQQVDLLRHDLSERTERLRRLSSGINEPG